MEQISENIPEPERRAQKAQEHDGVTCQASAGILVLLVSGRKAGRLRVSCKSEMLNLDLSEAIVHTENFRQKAGSWENGFVCKSLDL